MQVIVRSAGSTFVVSVPEGSTVSDLKAAIEDVEFIPSEYMWLSCGTSVLSNGTLAGLVEEEDTVTVNFDINGGMRNKWRKKRMRRLRRKRRKMRQRAR
jgi:small subunit ribosomal protein S27Ae